MDEKEYEHILGILRSMSLVMERDPDAFATLDEESIRTHFLPQLNGHYEGGASGETFNLSALTSPEPRYWKLRIHTRPKR